MNRRTLRTWRPVLVWVAVILVATTVPLPDAPLDYGVFPVDRLVHFGLYAGLGWSVADTLGRTGSGGSPVAWLLAWSGGLVFGALDELHQHWVPGRVPSPGDWVADALGVTAGLFLWLVGRRVRRVWGGGKETDASGRVPPDGA